MKLVFRGLVLLTIIFSLVSCRKQLNPAEIPAHIALGESYYTQFAMQYEKGAHVTTNYRRGALMPVNTKVTLNKITVKSIEVQVDNVAKPFVIKNIQKHTGNDIFQTFDKTFSRKKVKLSNFNSLERKHIKAGTVVKGMRKKAVTVAIGYPPITETMSLDADTWVYWSGRFNKFKVNFNKGKVISIVD